MRLEALTQCSPQENFQFVFNDSEFVTLKIQTTHSFLCFKIKSAAILNESGLSQSC